jgi:hypothetical protein
VKAGRLFHVAGSAAAKLQHEDEIFAQGMVIQASDIHSIFTELHREGDGLQHDCCSIKPPGGVISDVPGAGGQLK